ncbi:hypothetical protein EIN_498090 [Entamoeba invadens IP1]|uniref:Uncharacterized protein n=1 Tax=Entamoeba invadens IP1 TaxID=370355 RepID=A0A0A1UDU9_ENTIV|nr:hypothetical protein EIN_498090 [Entamoeba invadens IP1]ELP94619.1 hypothetical protein EIN_498090 [Entamoeba invadens IP1]|eukprot:XP_004261390.1 hypothetical protein EIN_498090 [Entamoeba invadens IP1]
MSKQDVAKSIDVTGDKKDWDYLKRSSKTFEACQQGALLGLLSLFGVQYEIEKVYKKSTKTSPLLTVKSVEYFNKKIDVINYVTLEMDKAVKCCGQEKKWASRLIKRSMDALSFSVLLEVAAENSIACQMKKTRKTEFTIVMKKVRSITAQLHNMLFVLDKETIRDFGLSVNRTIIDRMAGSNRKSSLIDRIVTVNPYDQQIEKLFEKYICKGVYNNLSAFKPVPSILLDFDGTNLEVKSFISDSSDDQKRNRSPIA